MRTCLMLLAIAVSVVALADQPESKSAAIKFGDVTGKPVKISLGKTLKLDAEFKVIEVGKATAVSVHGEIANPSNKKIHYSYQVAFLDKEKNLIGCQNYTHWADPGKPSKAGTFISLPADQIARIDSYSVVFYESDQPIGTR